MLTAVAAARTSGRCVPCGTTSTAAIPTRRRSSLGRCSRVHIPGVSLPRCLPRSSNNSAPRTPSFVDGSRPSRAEIDELRAQSLQRRDEVRRLVADLPTVVSRRTVLRSMLLRGRCSIPTRRACSSGVAQARPRPAQGLASDHAEPVTAGSGQLFVSARGNTFMAEIAGWIAEAAALTGPTCRARRRPTAAGGWSDQHRRRPARVLRAFRGTPQGRCNERRRPACASTPSSRAHRGSGWRSTPAAAGLLTLDINDQGVDALAPPASMPTAAARRRALDAAGPPSGRSTSVHGRPRRPVSRRASPSSAPACGTAAPIYAWSAPTGRSMRPRRKRCSAPTSPACCRRPSCC